ncbi:GNAT family N-acetyltransferase [Nocardia sp. NPDC024068]|uniref:GNAT family N-acetyltransferase n=1 Tax=Nocardia sp. NPDC024068 TaxID=3157197 RepID=UPI0033E5C665
MISYRWRAELDAEERAQVSALVRAAAEYDAEAGFSAIPPSVTGERSHASIRVAHLPILARRDLSVRVDAPWVTVAYLNLAVDADGAGTVRFVVHPDYRSRGIATLLTEELGLDTAAPGGWAGTGARSLRAWAYGTHPATERLAARFDIAAIDRRWTLVRHLSGPWAVPLAGLASEAALPGSEPVRDLPGLVELETELLPGPVRETPAVEHGRERAITVRDADGPMGMVRFDTACGDRDGFRAAWIGAVVVAPRAAGRGLGSALLSAALGEMRAAGVQLALLRMDPREERAVRMCRLLAFEQEEAHVRFGVYAT